MRVERDQRAVQLPDIYRSLADHMTELLLLIDFDGRQIATLGPSPGLLGFRAGELEGEHIAERVHPDDLPRVLELLERGRHTPGLEGHVIVRAKHRDGEWRSLRVTAFSRINHPLLRGGVVRVQPHSEPPAPQGSAAAVERSRFVSLAEALPVGVLSADAHGFVVFANDATQHLLGVGFPDLRGDGWLEQIHERDRAEVVAEVERLATASEPVRLTFATRASGGQLWLQLVLVPLIDHGRYVGWTATLDDVTERLVAQRELAYRATHDPLTGLPNRWLLLDRLEQSLARLGRAPRGVAVVYVDLDGFKAYNDDHGHAGGDAVLADVAARLRDALAPGDTAARMGGDEFVVLSEVDDWPEAANVAAWVESALTYDFWYQDTRLSVSASVGVAFSRDPDATLDTLLATADAAMYASREARRR